MRQLQALALARSGARERARELTLELYREGYRDAETVGILAGREKDLAALARDAQERRARLGSARDLYLSAYESASTAGDVAAASYNGANAASLSLLLGEEDAAREIAAAVRDMCAEDLQSALARGADVYWLEATLGEVALVLEAWSEAEEHYTRAAEAVGGRYADLSSTRRQARVLLAHQGRDAPGLERALRLPRVVVFSGHLADRPDAETPRFPSELEGAAAEAIAEHLEQLDARIGYASAACGGDLLFLEAMLARGGELQIVLPFPPDEFRRVSVDLVPGSDWGRRFEAILERAAAIHVATQSAASASSVSFEYANLLLDGLASLRAEHLDTDLTALALCGRRAPARPGGTASLVSHWRAAGRRVEIIDPGDLSGRASKREGDTRERQRAKAAADPGPRSAQRIMAMLFADVVGFTRLDDAQIRRFVDGFLGGISNLVEDRPYSPVGRNTWGDALAEIFP